MKLTSVYRKAWAFYRRHFGALMLTLLLELALRCIALTPLLFLAVPQTRFLALLSIPLWVLIVLPARQNAAIAMQAALENNEGPFSLVLISLDHYKDKLLRGLLGMLRMLLWFIPLIAGVILALWAFYGPVDGLTMIRMISSFGGGIKPGFQRILFIYLLTLIPPLLGFAFHSGARHAAALGRPRATRGHHLRLMLLWLGDLVLLVPFLTAAGMTAANYVRSVIDNLNRFSLSLPDPGPTLRLMVIFAGVLLLPLIFLIPLHALRSAVYMRAVQADARKVGAVHDAA